MTWLNMKLTWHPINIPTFTHWWVQLIFSTTIILMKRRSQILILVNALWSGFLCVSYSRHYILIVHILWGSYLINRVKLLIFSFLPLQYAICFWYRWFLHICVSDWQLHLYLCLHSLVWNGRFDVRILVWIVDYSSVAGRFFNLFLYARLKVHVALSHLFLLLFEFFI